MHQRAKEKVRRVVATALVGAMAAAMTVAAVPKIMGTDTVNADATKNSTNTWLGTSVIEAPERPESYNSSWGGSYVYFGSYNDEPIKFSVLAPSTTAYGGETMFLDSTSTLFKHAFDNNNKVWAESELRTYLNGTFYNEAFSAAEQSAIASSTIASHPLVEGVRAGNVTDWAYRNFVNTTPLTGEKIFLLDIEEVSNLDYGYTVGDDIAFNKIKGDGWWLRSTIYDDPYSVGKVDTQGAMYGAPDTSPDTGVAPALNIDLASVLFSTKLPEDPSINGTQAPEYKLTIIDTDLSIAVTSGQQATISGTTITVPYTISGADSANATRASILITDKKYDADGAKILLYESLGSSKTTTGTFTLPSNCAAGGWGSSYHVYIIAEDINTGYDGKETDYASTPVELSKPVQLDPDPTDTPTATPTKKPTATPTKKPTATPTPKPTAAPAEADKPGVEDFVERLYTVALGRESDPYGKADWINRVKTQGYTGADLAEGFLYSDEFLGKGLSDTDFLDVLYATFFDRASDEGGKTNWLNAMAAGMTKKQVIRGFIDSTEWANLCLNYGIMSGGTGVPNITVEPSSQVIEFATRLYTTCLGRDADPKGLNDWATQLANLQISGSQAAHGFFFSEEFLGQNFSDDEYVARLYRTFMGREPDLAGFADWISRLATGTSREEVFQGFAGSDEWAGICAEYGILK